MASIGPRNAPTIWYDDVMIHWYKEEIVDETLKMINLKSQFNGDLQALDEKVNSMMEKSLNMITAGKRAKGNP